MIAIDFETFYDKKNNVSIVTQGTYHYIHDPQFHVLLVAVYGEGIEFCGPPEEFDWTLIDGKDVCAHNASFDAPVLEYLTEQSWWPEGVRPKEWHCTADLAAWMESGRSLLVASRVLLHHRHSKKMRSNMSGKTMADVREEGFMPELIRYGMDDAKLCHRLWEMYSDKWPAKEQEISRLNRVMGEKGIRVDMDLLQEGRAKLSRALWDAEAQIPWEWPEGKTPLSPKKLAVACREAGIPVPETTNKREKACQMWMDTYGKEFPWVAALHQWRSANSMLNRLDTLEQRLRPDGTVAVDLLYFGAHTGRFTGVGGLNFGNFAKGEILGVDVRKMLIAREGHVFHIADLAQIEPRVLAVVSGDEEFIQECRRSSPYQAHALGFMGWEGKNLKKEDPVLYALAKARVLALGYGAGWQRFLDMITTYIPDEETRDQIFLAPVTPDDIEGFESFLSRQRSIRAQQQLREFEEGDKNDRLRMVNSWKQVSTFRSSNPLITGLWYQFDNALRSAANSDGVMEVALPSGRVKSYRHISSLKGEYRGVMVLGDKMQNLYGGLITENIIQAVARDVFIEGYLRLAHTEGYHIPFHVYDEYIVEVPEGTDPQKTVDLICQPVEWLPELPVAVEIVVSQHYLK